MNGKPEKPEKTEAEKRAEQAFVVLIYFMLFGLCGVIAFTIGHKDYAWKVLAGGFMIAAASLLSGGLLGFLFGIPRSAQATTPANASNEAEGAQGLDRKDRASVEVNTNLEQISDWLTKIIVGVGLTQLMNIPGKLNKIAGVLAKGMGLGNTTPETTFIICLILFYLICGFLFGYLWTRLYSPLTFLHSLLEGKNLSDELNRVKKNYEILSSDVEKAKAEAEQDRKALQLTNQCLNLGLSRTGISQEQLNKAIFSATLEARVQIFYLTHGVRRDQTDIQLFLGKKDKSRISEAQQRIEYTIPIFLALIRCDEKNEYHRNHGELGFALMYQTEPNYSDAIKQFDEAVKIRNGRKLEGWLAYEFNRAKCHIMLGDQEAHDMICVDLGKAYKDEKWRKIITRKEDKIIDRWLNENKYTVTDEGCDNAGSA